MSVIKKTMAIGGTISVIGAGIGFVAEKHEDSVARGRIVTVDRCLGSTAYENTISKELLDCLQRGVPGGNKSGPGFHEHDPLADIEPFRQHQQQEAHSDFGKVARGALISPLIAVGLGSVAVPIILMGGAGDYS